MSSSNFGGAGGGGSPAPGSLEEAIVDLYLNVKIRSNDDINRISDDQLELERSKLTDISPFIIIEYIKSSIEILMNLKLEEQQQNERDRNEDDKEDSKLSETSREGPPRDYEAMLIKLEGEVRTHIRIEQQLKLHIENTQQKVEDLERAKQTSEAETNEVMDGMKKDNQRLLDLLTLRDQEISELKGRLDRRLEEVQVEEERLSRTAQLEKQVIYLEKKYDRDIQKLTKELKAQYKRNSELKGTLQNQQQQLFNPAEGGAPLSGSMSHRGDVQNVRHAQTSLSKSPHESGRSTSRLSTAAKTSRGEQKTTTASEMSKSKLMERNREISKLKGEFSRSKEAKKSQRHFDELRQSEPLGTSQIDRNSESYLVCESHNGYEQGTEIAKLKQKINRLQNQMTVSKKSSVERNPPQYDGYGGGEAPGHKRSKSQCRRADLSAVCGAGNNNQSHLMKTPDMESQGTFDEFHGTGGGSTNYQAYRQSAQEKENFDATDFICSGEFDGSSSRIPVRKSELLEQHTPSTTHYNQSSGCNTARERSASKPRISRPGSTLKDHQHGGGYGNQHQHSKSGGGGGGSHRGSTYLSSSLSQSSYKKKPNYAASGTSNGGTASAAASGRASAQYNYSRSKKQAL